MHIIIEIKDTEITVRDSESKQPVSQTTLSTPGESELGPPSEVLETAASIGAMNAGSAPNFAGKQPPGAPPLPEQTRGLSIPDTDKGGMSAGAAPTTPPDVLGADVDETEENGDEDA